MIITIDGPAASGKSTVARTLARQLDFYYVCSGLLYRSLGYLLLNFRSHTLQSLSEITQTDIDSCFDKKRFSYRYDVRSGEHISFDEKDITLYLKESLIDQVASIISANMLVRDSVTKLQRFIASNHNIVIDGRDVGSIVFPQAQYKFFMTASTQVRAQRWQKDQEKYGNYFSLPEAVVAITARDDRDKNRAIDPLVIPEGAISIDTSYRTIEQVVELIMQYMHL